MVDSPDRASPRFPATIEAAVHTKINATLDDWQIGTGDLCICGGARGGDILFAEHCLENGADLRLYLPLEKEAFLEASVRLPPDEDSDWENRFNRILGRSKACWPVEAPKDRNPFAANNARMIDATKTKANGGPIYLLLLWDGKGGDGEGGTSDLAHQLKSDAQHIVIIDPTELLSGDS